MSPEKQKFLSLLLNKNVLRFGDFKTKSGRNTPYFLNFGSINSGESLKTLSLLYAEKIKELFAPTSIPDNLFGPAYKGIPLCTSVAISTSNLLKQDISFTFNRKEIKDHGEKGGFVGYEYKGGESVLIVEDVLTAGTSINESLSLLRDQKVNIIGILVGVDREEKGISNLLASSEVKNKYGIDVFSLMNISEIIDSLYNKTFLDKIWINETQKAKIDEYRKDNT